MWLSVNCLLKNAVFGVPGGSFIGHLPWAEIVVLGPWDVAAQRGACLSLSSLLELSVTISVSLQ